MSLGEDLLIVVTMHKGKILGLLGASWMQEEQVC